jgi:hypothetical protein
LGIFFHRIDRTYDLLAAKIRSAYQAGDDEVAVLVILDRNAVRNAPASDDTGRQWPCGLSDPILLGPMDVAFDVLQPCIGTSRDAKANSRGGRWAFDHGARHARPRDTGDIPGGSGQNRATAGSGRSVTATEPQLRYRIPVPRSGRKARTLPATAAARRYLHRWRER